MIHKPRLRHLGRTMAFAALFSTGAATGVFGQAAKNPATVPGEIILYMQPGTGKDVVTALAAKVTSASVTPLLLKDCYVIELPVKRATLQDTADAVSTLKMDPNVRWVNASVLYKTMQAPVAAPTKLIPNDPRFPEQWALNQIRMPQAWLLQKGAVDVNLGWIDSGFDPKHEDALGQFLSGSYDFGNNTTDITATGDDHGVSTSGVAFALTDNAKGIAGVDWTNTKCLALKVGAAGLPGFLSGPGILNSYAYLLANKDRFHIVAVNMSYGRPFGNPNDVNAPDYVATKALTDAGVLMVASAGNFGDQGNPTSTPAFYAHIISVAATDINGKTTSYSEFGKVDIAAPGGDAGFTGVDANGVLLLKQNSQYAFEDGTSFAAPHVTAVLGLLMSVPGVTPDQAKQAMFDTANRKALALTSLPDPHYGYGVLDAYAALLRVSVSIITEDPLGINATGVSTDPTGFPPPPVETLKPNIRFKVSGVPVDQLNVTIDPGTPQQIVLTSAFLRNQIESGNTTGLVPHYVISFRYAFPSTAQGNHKIVISGANVNLGITATDTRTFSIQSHIFPPGTSLVSIPYAESAIDSPTGKTREAGDLLDKKVILARFLYKRDANSGTLPPLDYIYFNGTDTVENAASLYPTEYKPVPNNANISGDTSPLGVGYFLLTKTPISVVTYGQSFDTTSFRIPLHEGWNMVGNPYKFAVPFDGLEFEDLSGNRLTAEAAADKNLILPFIYRYVGGQYQFEHLPAGNLQPWEGQWIFVVKREGPSSTNPILTMITTPVAVSGFGGRAARMTRAGTKTTPASLNTPPRIHGGGGWTVQLEASGNDLHDGYNFIGVTRSAVDSARSLAPKPPHPSPYITLGMTRKDGKGAVYAQDLQVAGGVKTWDVVVMTDQPNTDITLRWPNISTLPKSYRLTMLDKATGQEIDLRHQAAYQFNSGHQAVTREFTLTAHPTNAGGRAVLTNIVVNPPRVAGSRGAGAYEIGYTVSQDARVEVAIIGYNGQTLAQIGSTRAVSSGDNRQVWNGKDTRGANVPAGTYLLQLRAITPDGTVSREIRPLTITR